MRYYKIALVVAVAVAVCALPALCQEEKAAAPAATPTTPAATPVAAPVAMPAAEGELSIYGEVQTVNADGSSLTVQYYDYDTDEEKTAEIAVAKDAKIEGAAGVSEIKKGDWVDATYRVEAGKNIAKSLIVEKEELEPVTEVAKTAPEEPLTTEPMEE